MLYDQIKMFERQRATVTLVKSMYCIQATLSCPKVFVYDLLNCEFHNIKQLLIKTGGPDINFFLCVCVGGVHL